MLLLVAAVTLVACVSASNPALLACKATFHKALNNATDVEAECKAFSDLSACFTDVIITSELTI